METKKMFTVMPSNDSPSFGPYVFSEKDKAEKLALFLNRNLSCYTECETRLVELDQLPILEKYLCIPAFDFLRGVHFFRQKIFSSVTDTQEDDCAGLRLSIHEFQFPLTKKGFFITWEDLFLRATGIIFQATCYHRLTESDLENNYSSEEIEAKAIGLLHEFSKDWFYHVTEEYPVTSALIEEKKISFHIYEKGMAADILITNAKGRTVGENGEDVAIYKSAERENEYVFETKDGQMFLDSLSEKMRNQV